MPENILNRDHHCKVYYRKGRNYSSPSEKRVCREINERINKYVGMYGLLRAKAHGIKIFGPDDSDWTESLSFSCE
jgi:hypothetical protein